MVDESPVDGVFYAVFYEAVVDDGEVGGLIVRKYLMRGKGYAESQYEIKSPTGGFFCNTHVGFVFCTLKYL